MYSKKPSWTAFPRLLTVVVILSCPQVFAQSSPAAKGPQTHSSSPPQKHLSLADSFQSKLEFVQQNAKQERPNPRPTDIGDDELNAWLSSGKVKLPAGVQRVTFRTQPDVIQSDLRVDFDALTENKRSANPLLYFFTGVHDVTVIADAHGDHAKAAANVRSVTIDGIEVPRMALELFVKRYLQPKYPKAALEATFDLPARIDSAVIGNAHTLIVQK